MATTEPILDLLRTNSVDRYLMRRARNSFIVTLREVLHALGYGEELAWERLGADNYYGEETVGAVRAFAARNRLLGDGSLVTPGIAVQLVNLYDVLDGVSMLQRALEKDQLYQAFRPTDPNNYGAQQLRTMLEALGFNSQPLTKGLAEFANQQRLANVNGWEMTPALARALLNELIPRYGAGLQLTPGPDDQTDDEPVAILPPKPIKELNIIDSPNGVLVSDGSVQIQFLKRGEGVTTFGHQSVETYVRENRDKLANLEMTPAAINVVEAISKNEGRLDSINTYDRGFVSLGIFQWTLGRDEKAGELPALLNKVKKNYPATFRNYFQELGLDIDPTTNTTYGYLTYNGQQVAMPALKDQFRDPSWAFRFWRASRDPNVQAVQVKHALARLNNFYWQPNLSALGYTLNQIITSSYGVALLLDNHVNRPAWVHKCVEQAMLETGLTNPQGWTQREEQRVLDAYLRIRSVYQENGFPPMTKADERAQAIALDLRDGKLSAQRGSFAVTEFSLRSYGEGSTGVAAAVPPPPYFAPQDYPEIEMDIY